MTLRYTLQLTIAALALALVGCANLPSQVQRPVSQAMATEAVATTTLARIAAASAPPDSEDRSGFRLLPVGDHALDARIALARRAEKSIDVQYYLIASDTTGLQLLRELRDAAARGVRVRLIVDDLYANGQDELFAGLAAQPNVEVRLFNPLPVREGGFVSRIVFSLHDFSRINRRMHNKLFVVDNTFAISGGRNIADEYFGRAEPANFIDMDLLSSGPVVRELSAAFDAYWNSNVVYPVQSLVAQTPDAARQQFDAQVANVAAPVPATTIDTLGQSSVSAQLEAGRLEQHLGLARVVVDLPSKVEARNEADGAVMSANLELIRSARSEVLVASPYFVPGERGVAAMQKAIDNNVHLTVMTNSLATTDEPLAHFGYSRYRSAMLKMGAKLYELMPESLERRVELGAGSHGSLGRLHAKVAVVDARWLYIGSMNMDRRSAHCNTEIGLIVDSGAIAGQVSALLQGERLPRSYQLRIAGETGRIEWVANAGAQTTVHQNEPAATWLRSVRSAAVIALVGEAQL